MRPNSSVPPQPKASTPSLRTTSALERSLHDGLIANPPPGAPRFDDQVDLAHKQMRTCTFSRTADGMQTQESFIQYLEQLDREITAHSDAAVAAGGEPIERPVVLCLDNHASRYSEEVLKAASGQSARLGIRLFTEEPMTSGFLQSLDQYNAKGSVQGQGMCCCTQATPAGLQPGSGCSSRRGGCTVGRCAPGLF